MRRRHTLAEIQQVYGPKALGLAADVRTAEAIHDPTRRHYEAAGKYLSLYFESYVARSSAQADEAFFHVIDATTSVLLGMFRRDEYTHRHTVGKPIGSHPADKPLGSALVGTRDVLREVTAHGGADMRRRSLTSASEILSEYRQARHDGVTPDTDPAKFSLRARAAEAVTGVRYLAHEVDHFPRLTIVGNHAALAIFSFGDVGERHARDSEEVTLKNSETGMYETKTQDVPLHRDGLARDIGAALEAAYDPLWPHLTPASGRVNLN